jgi:type I restriction enzyme, S subunit
MSEFLQFIRYKELSNWSVLHQLSNVFNYKKHFELVRIGDFITRNKTIVNVEDKIEYKRVTIKLYNKGVTLRDKVLGRDIGTKKQFLLKQGQFLFSKIDARNGAFGIATAEIDNAIITGDFLAYDINNTKIDLTFLVLLTTTSKFLDFAQGASSGTTGRQRISEKEFLNVRIPLPTLAEQQKIVSFYKGKVRKAIENEKQEQERTQYIKQYLFDTLELEKPKEEKNNNILQFVRYKNIYSWDAWNNEVKIISIYPVCKVRTIIKDISTGTTPPTGNRKYFENGSINFYAPADLGHEMYLYSAERKITQLAIDDKKARCFKKHTLLFVGIGSTIGKVGLVNNSLATSNQQITGLTFDTEKIKPEYAFCYFNYFKHITIREKAQSTIPIVNQEKILNIPIPLPPLVTQNRIVETIKENNLKIKQHQTLAKQLRQEAIQEFENEIFI